MLVNGGQPQPPLSLFLPPLNCQAVSTTAHDSLEMLNQMYFDCTGTLGTASHLGNHHQDQSGQNIEYNIGDRWKSRL